MSQGFLIGETLLGQIKDTVKRVQGEPMVGNISRIETRFEGGPATPASKTFRICTFTGAWAINATKTVTFRNQTTAPNTAVAVNLVCGLNPTASCDVSVAKDGTAWYLVQPNLTQQPGYSTSGTQVLTIQNGSLAWVGTTAC
jgi:hypothetical protein